MLTMYLDETGHETKGWMFVAGFLGNDEQWRALASLWKAALGRQRKHLHVKELRFKKERDKKLLSALGPIPEQCRLRPVLGGVRYQDYEDLVTGTAAQRLLKGYIACLYPVVINALRVVPRDETLHIIFERQDEYQRHTEHMLSALSQIRHHSKGLFLTQDGSPRIAKWSFVPKDSTVLTEPADYFAYALLQHYRNRDSVRSKWCEPILKSGNGEGIGAIMTRQQIRTVVQGTPIMALHLQILRSKGMEA